MSEAYSRPDVDRLIETAFRRNSFEGPQFNRRRQPFPRRPRAART